jgi:hypothetical protein
MQTLVCLATLACLALGAAAASVSVSGQSHRFLCEAELKTLSDEKPGLTARATDPHAVRDRTFYRAGSVIPMAGGFVSLGYYYVNVSVGTQSFSLLLDTGSSNLAVPGVQCPTCGSDPNRYDPSKSRTAQIVPFNSAQCAVCSPDGSVAPDCPFGLSPRVLLSLAFPV